MGKLKQNNLLTMMDRMRSLVPPEESAPDCTQIDWRIPRHFGQEAVAVLTDFATKLAIHLQKTLQALCDDGVEVLYSEMNEHFSSEIFPVLNQDRKHFYYLQVELSDSGQVGFLEFPFETCTKLIALMLKNPDAQIGQEEELSALEESILMDVAGPIMDSVIDGFTQHGQSGLRPSKTMIKGDETERFGQIDDMCQLSFMTHCCSSELGFSLYILDELIDPLVGIDLIDRSPETFKQMPERVISRVQDVTMDVSVRLSAGMIDLQDILMLQSDDVLLLERKVDMPADVLINGRHCFEAWPAEYTGKRAVVFAGQKTED